METAELVEYKLLMPKAKVKKLKSLLEKEGASLERLTQKPRKGKYKPGEKPSDAIKAIADREQEDFNEVRRKAWGGRGVN